MQGAREYARMFKTGQYGRLYITSGSHARGYTFRIQILPEGITAIGNGPNQCINKEAVEVYGIRGGQPGWTEYYGWLHEGKWQQDFENLVAAKKAELEEAEKEAERRQVLLKEEERSRQQRLLDSYR